jgi:hypothetical protein
MFEFTLSKINMLVFVTAIAVVVIFFMNTLHDNLRTRQSFETTYKIGKEFKSLIDADSYCSIKFIQIPKTIKLNEGATSSALNLNYLLGLQKYSLTDKKALIIYITDHKNESILGAYNLEYNGDFKFYSSEYDSGNYTFSPSTDENITYNPRKVNGNETRFLLIKNIKNSHATYYMFPCEKKNGIETCKSFVCNETTEFEDLDDIPCLSSAYCTPEIRTP